METEVNIRIYIEPFSSCVVLLLPALTHLIINSGSSSSSSSCEKTFILYVYFLPHSNTRLWLVPYSTDDSSYLPFRMNDTRSITQWYRIFPFEKKKIFSMVLCESLWLMLQSDGFLFGILLFPTMPPKHCVFHVTSTHTHVPSTKHKIVRIDEVAAKFIKHFNSISIKIIFVLNSVYRNSYTHSTHIHTRNA